MDEIAPPPPADQAEDASFLEVQARSVRLAVNGRVVVASGSILLFEDEVLSIQPFRGTKNGPTVEVVFITNPNIVPRTPRSEARRDGKTVRWTFTNCDTPTGGLQYINELTVYRGKAIRAAVFHQLLTQKPVARRVDFTLYYTSFVSPERRPRRQPVLSSAYAQGRPAS